MKLSENYATGIQHIGIPVKNIDITKDFYTRLGFIPAFETVNNGSRVLFLKLADLVVEAYEAKETAGTPGAIDHFAINVKDIEQTYRDICTMNMNSLEDEIHFLPFWENGVRFFTIQGPDKERIEFSQFLTAYPY